MSERIAVRLIVRGRVQGVGYREWARRTAQRLGIAGFVRNISSDGCVEALLIGEAAAVQAMAEACREGPDFARVTEITATSLDAGAIASLSAAGVGATDFLVRDTVASATAF